MSSEVNSRSYRVVIVGGGPAGSSLAIRLATAGHEVTLLERAKFPRPKLCGEFISPGCLDHFAELGVLDEMMSLGGEQVYRTAFFDTTGRGTEVPSKWLGQGSFALALSREAMDECLLNGARSAGAAVYEEMSAAGVRMNDGCVRAVIARSRDGTTRDLEADLFIDATGRTAVLAKLISRAGPSAEIKPTQAKPVFIGFKAHFRNAAVERGVCELYSFRGGYGGLTRVENDLANLCFLIRPKSARTFENDPQKIVTNIINANPRARAALAGASTASQWNAVAVESFGRKRPVLAANAFAIGDAAAFIDPFTGSGILLALESGKLLADVLLQAVGGHAREIASLYSDLHDRQFGRRLRTSAIFRSASASPLIASGMILALRSNDALRRYLARRTRLGRPSSERLP